MTLLTLPILFNIEVTKQHQQLIDLGIETCDRLKETELRDITFYEITAISTYKEDGRDEMTMIYAGGTEFICDLKIEKVKYLIYENT